MNYTTNEYLIWIIRCIDEGGFHKLRYPTYSIWLSKVSIHVKKDGWIAVYSLIQCRPTKRTTESLQNITRTSTSYRYHPTTKSRIPPLQNTQITRRWQRLRDKRAQPIALSSAIWMSLTYLDKKKRCSNRYFGHQSDPFVIINCSGIPISKR